MSNQNTFLLDKNAVIYLINGEQTVLDLIDNKSVAINFVVEIELLCWPNMTIALQKIINNLLKEIQYFDYSHRIKQSTIEIRKSTKLKLGDALIAATALEYDLTLVSADKSFSKIQDLRLINFLPTSK